MYNIIFKTNPQFSGLGLCSFTDACPEPVKLIDVNGTITITDNKNKLTLNIVNDVISIPILIDDDITGKTNITIQEVDNQSRQIYQSLLTNSGFSGLGAVNPAQTKSATRFYQLSIGKLFKTRFRVTNNEFNAMAKEMNEQGSWSSNTRNVIEMNISFKTESGLQLISKSPK